MRGEDSLHALFEVEYDGLVRLAFLLCGNAHTAEEVTQEAFVRAADRWPRLSGYDRPGAWLRLVVVRLTVRRRRRAGAERGLEGLPEVSALDPPVPDPEIYEALRAVSDVQRQCLVLHHIGDLSVEEVARLLDMAEGTVRSHLHRGRQAMVVQLGGGAGVNADREPTR